MVNDIDYRQSRGVVDLNHLMLGGINVIRYVGNGGDHVHVKLTEQPLLYDFHMQQAEESAAEAEPQRQRTLGFEHQGGVVQLKFLQRRAQLLILVRLYGIYTREEHRLDLFETGDCAAARALDVGDCITYLNLNGIFYTGDYVSHAAALYGFTRHKFHLKDTYLVGDIFAAGIYKFHLVAGGYAAVHHLEIGDDAAERVEYAVKYQRLKGSLRVALGGRYLVHYGIQNLLDPLSGLGTHQKHIIGVATQQIHNLVAHHLGLCGIHINLVDDRDYLKVVVNGQIEVRYGLRLDALRGIYNQQCPFAGGNCA